MTNPVLHAHESWSPIVIAISGSSGLIGSAVAKSLTRLGHTVRCLVRRDARTANEISWDPQHDTIDAARFAGVDVVINFAGENLAQRWTDGVKRRVRESRVSGTRLLARTAAAANPKPRAFLTGSAIGVYGNRGDEILDETSDLGTDFLSTVCKDWEAAAMPAADAGIRVVALRTGLVLARDRGLLVNFLRPFRLGIGGRLGSGRQWMSWITLADYVDAVVLLIRQEEIAGPVNLTAPNPVTNAEFTQTLARVLRRPAIIPVPRFALTLLLGQMAEDMALASQCVRPRRLLDHGFAFGSSTLEAGLRSALNPVAQG
ncbi:MAG: TIGR01777 family oxidoreductase [bacterium]